MTKVALDTNAYRALVDGNPLLAKTIRTTVSIGIPITVLGELYFGIYNGSKQEQNNLELEKFISSPRVEILHSNEITAKIFGEIATELRHLGRPIQQDDMWIAALCKQYDYKLATADSGFDNIVGLEIIHF